MVCLRNQEQGPDSVVETSSKKMYLSSHILIRQNSRSEDMIQFLLGEVGGVEW